MAKKSVSLPGSNLRLINRGMDRNGNSVVKVHFVNQKGFSIQTNSHNLRGVKEILKGKTQGEVMKLSKTDLTKIGRQVRAYVKKHGSDNQKKRLRIYKI